MSEHEQQNRREFLSGMGRWAILGALAMGVGALTLKGECQKGQSRRGCAGCPEFAGCGLEQAKEARRSERSQGDNGLQF